MISHKIPQPKKQKCEVCFQCNWNVLTADILQIAVARNYIDYHTEKFGYKEANIEFVKGYIERLQEAGLQRNCFDIIM